LTLTRRKTKKEKEVVIQRKRENACSSANVSNYILFMFFLVKVIHSEHARAITNFLHLKTKTKKKFRLPNVQSNPNIKSRKILVSRNKYS
jgi:hypothetical protein